MSEYQYSEQASAAYGACEESFASWCDNFGLEVDSRKALSKYMACQENADKLHKVFTHVQIAHIQELLQEY